MKNVIGFALFIVFTAVMSGILLSLATKAVDTMDPTRIALLVAFLGIVIGGAILGDQKHGS
jgi:hypothetical protein